MKTTIVAFLLLVSASVHADCIMEMNGDWLLNPAKSLDEGGPDWETLAFSNTESEQRYTMEYLMEDGEKGRLDWAVPCDGDVHPSPPAPWDDAPGRTIRLTRLGEKTELVTHMTDGETTNTYTRVLIDDDNTLISIGRLPDGTIEWVRVFDRR